MALPIKGNSTQTKASFTTFLILPLSILFLWPNILDSNGIPKLIAFSIGSLLMFAITKIKLRFHFILLFPFLLNLTYVISQFSLPNNFDKFLVGSYGRVGGMASSLLLAFIFLHIALGRYELVISFLKSILFYIRRYLVIRNTSIL